MTTIIFTAHATTIDNELQVATGHADVELSALGLQQAKELGEYYAAAHFAAIFCSDLQRSYKTAELAFGDKFPIIKDERLRECDYGDLSRQPKQIIEDEKMLRIATPFPNGESYQQTASRMKLFLADVLKNYAGKKVMIIGHRATQYGLEYWIKGIPLLDVVAAPWHWQPGWTYELTSLTTHTN